MKVTLLTEETIVPLVRKREKFSHKGTYGHALLIAGSKGKMGAAVLSARSCLRSGAGLLTAHIPSCGLDIMQISVPEAMCVTDKETDFVSSFDTGKASAIGIGPGTGTQKTTQYAVKQVLESGLPCVLDADALNLLAQNKELYGLLHDNVILTPHPGEFERLAGKTATREERLSLQIEFSEKQNCIIIVKDAETHITTSGGNVFRNTSGNPGMATGGSGDVLTGIILGLLTQGYSPEDAAKIAVWHHGTAGDKAAQSKGEYALIAGDIIENLRIG